MDGRLWDSVGHQLSKKGKEYKQRWLSDSGQYVLRLRPPRCAVRHAATGGGNVFLPASFPALEECDPLQPIKLPNLPPDDLEQVWQLLLTKITLANVQTKIHSLLVSVSHLPCNRSAFQLYN